jgi:RNA 2',3'-cyclic 3'-phosphodiesterase
MKKSAKLRKPPRPARVRCFFGLEFALYEQLAPLLQDLAQVAEDPVSKLRLSAAANMHLTLKFLGSIPETQLAAIERVMQQLAPAHPPLQLHCAGLGLFKNSLWVGIEENEELHALTGDLDRACALLGIASEQNVYVPHVTVARFSPAARNGLSTLIPQYADKKWGDLLADQAHLYRSDTLPEGARYSIIDSYKLGAGNKAPDSSSASDTIENPQKIESRQN